MSNEAPDFTVLFGFPFCNETDDAFRTAFSKKESLHMRFVWYNEIKIAFPENFQRGEREGKPSVAYEADPRPA